MTLTQIPPPDAGAQARRTAAKVLAAWILLPAFFFVTGGSIAWWQAWVYCAIVLCPMTVFVAYIVKRDPLFIARRSRYREKESSQRRTLAWGLPLQLAVFIVPGIDRRFGWSHPSIAVELAAMVIGLAAYLAILRVFIENRWAGRTIETYADQRVVSTGPYAIVRHPMYAASTVLYAATPVALGSWWALLPALGFIPVFVFRIRNEEEVLVRELAGYAEYRAKVRWRLVPFVW